MSSINNSVSRASKTDAEVKADYAAHLKKSAEPEHKQAAIEGGIGSGLSACSAIPYVGTACAFVGTSLQVASTTTEAVAQSKENNAAAAVATAGKGAAGAAESGQKIAKNVKENGWTGTKNEKPASTPASPISAGPHHIEAAHSLQQQQVMKP